VTDLGQMRRVIFGRALVQTVNDKADWSAPGGKHVATVGPLPIDGRVAGW
jgi:hypothetical protein